MRLSKRNPDKHYRPWRLTVLALRVLCALPVPLTQRLGRGVGGLFYWLDKKRRRFAERNIELCFPELSQRERRRLVRQHFLFLGQTLLSTLAVIWHRPDRRLQEWISTENEHHLNDAIASGRPVIVMAPHFLGLEVAWAWLSHGRQMVGMYRQPRPNLLHWAVDHQRCRFGGIAIEARGELKRMIKLIREGMPFYYLPDLDPGRRGRFTFAPFFGLPAATVTALSRIAQMTDALVVPCVAILGEPGQPFRLRFLAPLENFPGHDEDADAARINALVEEHIRQTPAQYFWIHRRFKTRPEGEPRLY